MTHSALTAAPPAAAPATVADMAKRLLGQAWPVLVAQWLSMAMMVADTVIAGRHGTADLAAVAVGSSFAISVVMLLSGVLQAVAPTVAHHVGAGREAEIGPALQQGFWLALLLAVPGVLLLASPGPALRLAGVPDDIAARAGSYLGAVAFGLPAVLLYRTFYAFCNAVGRPRVLMAISAVMTLSHVLLAWLLTQGAFGLAALGGVGCGVSYALVNWLALGCGAVYLWRHPAYRRYQVFKPWHAPRPRVLAGLVRLGGPMGLSSFIDITSFTLISLFAARMGVETVAGHRVVSNFTGLIYMVPLSLSIATLVLVGQACGAQDWARARLAVRVGIGLVAALATVIGGFLWVLREPLVAVSTVDPAVRTVALGLLAYLCVYQFFDGVQTLVAYALRGYKVTLLPMLWHTACFWGVGLGGGYWLSFEAGFDRQGPAIAGFWQASVLATLLASLVLGLLLRQVVRMRQTA